jgi:predicted RNA-binding Zn ribbon-like protein
MTDNKSQAGKLKLLGGELCLDFANTVGWHDSDDPKEWLNTYSDLMLWGKHAGMLTDKEAQKLIDKASKRTSEAKRILEKAIQLRETIYRIFSSLIGKSQPIDEDLSILNSFLSDAMGRSRVIRTKEGFSWGFHTGKGSLDWVLHPIARSTAELLASDKLQRVKKCSGPYCGWLFLDTSRNRSRRWCDMKDCGNRAKAKRHYHRKRKSNQPTLE